METQTPIHSFSLETLRRIDAYARSKTDDRTDRKEVHDMMYVEIEQSDLDICRLVKGLVLFYESNTICPFHKIIEAFLTMTRMNLHEKSHHGMHNVIVADPHGTISVQHIGLPILLPHFNVTMVISHINDDSLQLVFTEIL